MLKVLQDFVTPFEISIDFRQKRKLSINVKCKYNFYNKKELFPALYKGLMFILREK